MLTDSTLRTKKAETLPISLVKDPTLRRIAKN